MYQVPFTYLLFAYRYTVIVAVTSIMNLARGYQGTMVLWYLFRKQRKRQSLLLFKLVYMHLEQIADI